MRDFAGRSDMTQALEGAIAGVPSSPKAPGSFPASTATVM